MESVAVDNVVDFATLFPASLIGTALARLYAVDSLRNLLLPALEESGSPVTCPITLAPIENPVLLADGFVYEESQICQWLQKHTEAPCTNATLEHSCVLRLEPFRAAIEYFLLRSATGLESQSIASLRRTIDEASDASSPLNVRVSRLRSALSQAKSDSEALNLCITDARLLLVQLSSELSAARATAADRMQQLLATGLVREAFSTWCSMRSSNVATGVQQQSPHETLLGSASSMSTPSPDRRSYQQGAPIQMRQALDSSRGCIDSITSSRTSCSNADVLNSAMQASVDSSGCRFSMKHRLPTGRDAIQYCAFCGISDVVLFACSTCQREHYCSFGCQSKRWPSHKLQCESQSMRSEVGADSGDLQVGQTTFKNMATHSTSVGLSLPSSSTSSREFGSRNPASVASLHLAHPADVVQPVGFSVPSSSSTSHGPRNPPSGAPFRPPQSADFVHRNGLSIALPRSRDVLQDTVGSYCLETHRGSETHRNDTQGSNSARSAYSASSASGVCLDCGRHFGTRPPGGICDDCFRIHRGDLPGSHCLAYCQGCNRVIYKVSHPTKGSVCASCQHPVEPTCAVWRNPEGSRFSSQADCGHQALSATELRECSPAGQMEVDALIDCGIDAPCVERPREQEGICGSSRCLVPTSEDLERRLLQLQQETGLSSTGNLINDVGRLAAHLNVPCTTLSDAIANCEAALRGHRGRAVLPPGRGSAG